MPQTPITVNSHWQYKKDRRRSHRYPCQLPQVSYLALDKTFSGTLSQWLFLQDFQPAPERKKKTH